MKLKRYVYVFSKTPMDEEIANNTLNISVGLPKLKFNFEEKKNKYLKLFKIDSDKANMSVTVKYVQGDSISESNVKIPKCANVICYLSKKRKLRKDKPPKSYCLQFLEDEDNDFELCFDFINNYNIFSNSFHRNYKNDFQELFVTYKTVMCHNNRAHISHYFWRLLLYFKSNQNELDKNLSIQFLKYIANCSLSNNLYFLYSIVSFLLYDHQNEINNQNEINKLNEIKNQNKIQNLNNDEEYIFSPIDPNIHHDDSFDFFHDLIIQSVSLFGTLFIAWTYIPSFHDQIIALIPKNNLDFSLNLFINIISSKLLKVNTNSKEFNLLIQFSQFFLKDKLAFPEFIDLLEIENDKKESIKQHKDPLFDNIKDNQQTLIFGENHDWYKNNNSDSQIDVIIRELRFNNDEENLFIVPNSHITKVDMYDTYKISKPKPTSGKPQQSNWKAQAGIKVTRHAHTDQPLTLTLKPNNKLNIVLKK